ncbi:hypothetical protein MAA_01200 [Metarhizium robertsii ARSEF 23]|uniref:Uncharacterized protein n=1 Tax=Metarhizium robertsii (strain ARSEF 23 / ATCC MYA-3075) TaxID=655844 RepID=E9EN62_METRA|nr:uncharacterized protein MAA_01200 [Metarhizium robertsii ARSEF 23]EFZ04126.2 hypothetical protein MAA_01200 [Metarhizium robertsii ARSEF 23]
MADNQASANIMSLEFARQERITVEESVAVPFILGNGSVDYSVGRATADCALPFAPHFSGIRGFYVFSTSSQPLILGRAFLLETGLTKCPQNLIRCTTIKGGLSAPPTSPLSRIERSRWQIKAVVKHASVTHQTSVVPDKGSDFDIMSLAYAQRINAGMTPCQRDQDIVLLANGRVARVMGSAKVSIHFIGKASRLGPIPVRFVIIENLPFHIALGNPFLEKYRVFDRVSEFQWTHTTDDNALLCSCLRFSGKQPKEPISEIQDFTDRAVSNREYGYSCENSQQNLFANNQETPADAEIHPGRANTNNQETPADAEIHPGRANTNNQETPADAEIHPGRANTNNQETPADAEIHPGRANTNNQETPADTEIPTGRENTNVQANPAVTGGRTNTANANNQEGERGSRWRRSLMLWRRRAG